MRTYREAAEEVVNSVYAIVTKFPEDDPREECIARTEDTLRQIHREALITYHNALRREMEKWRSCTTQMRSLLMSMDNIKCMLLNAREGDANERA